MDRPTIPALSDSRPITAKRAANSTILLPTNSNRTANHLQEPKFYDYMTSTDFTVFLWDPLKLNQDENEETPTKFFASIYVSLLTKMFDF